MPQVDVATIDVNGSTAWVEHDRRTVPHTIKIYKRGIGDTKEVVWAGETANNAMSRDVFIGLCHAQINNLVNQ